MALKFPSYPVPLQYEYKPMALEAFAQPLAQLQHRFDTAKTALDDLDLGINSLIPDTDRTREIQQQLITKQQELVDELYKTKDSGYIAREIKKLNEIFNKNPEIKGLRNQYATYKDLDGQYRERQEKDPTTYPDPWRQADMTSRSYEYTQAGGLNYNWETGNYNAFDGSAPVPYLEAEIIKQAADMANTAAVQGGRLPDEVFVGVDGTVKSRINSIEFKNVDQMTREIAAVLRSTNRYQDFLNYEGKVEFNNLMAGTKPEERNIESNEIIDSHRKKITDYIAELTKKAEENPNIKLEEYLPYQQAIDYLKEIDENRLTKTPEELARVLFTKDFRDSKINDTSYNAADIEDFNKISDKFIGGNDGSGGSKGIKIEDASKYQVNVQGSKFLPENADGKPTYADYSTALEELKAGEIHGTIEEDGTITPTPYPQLGNWIINHPSNIRNFYENNKYILNGDETYNRKAETVSSVGHIVENTASRAQNYENWIETSTNIVADLKEKANAGTLTNEERDKLKELNISIPSAKFLYRNEFAKINFDLKNAAKSDEKLQKILENNSGEFNANTYKEIAQSYQNTLDELTKAATEDARLTGQLEQLELGYNPITPGATQSEPMEGIDLLQRPEINFENEALESRVTSQLLNEEGKVRKRAEIEAQKIELQKQQDLIKNIAPSTFREWNDNLNIKESSRTIALYDNEAVNNLTGGKVQELIKTIKEGGIEGLDQVIYDPTKASYKTVGTIKTDELDWSAYQEQTPTIEVVLDEGQDAQTVILGFNRDESKATPKGDINKYMFDLSGSTLSFQKWLEEQDPAKLQNSYEKSNPKKLFVAVENTNFGSTITQNAATNYTRLAQQELGMAARALQMGEMGAQLYKERNYIFGTLLSSMASISLVSDGEMQKDYMELSAGLTAAVKNGDFAAVSEQPTAVWKELENGTKEGYKIVYDLNADNRIVANIIKQTADKNYNITSDEYFHKIILDKYTPTTLRQLDLIYGTGSNPIISKIEQDTWIPMHTTLKSALPANAVGTVQK